MGLPSIGPESGHEAHSKPPPPFSYGPFHGMINDALASNPYANDHHAPVNKAPIEKSTQTARQRR